MVDWCEISFKTSNFVFCLSLERTSFKNSMQAIKRPFAVTSFSTYPDCSKDLLPRMYTCKVNSASLMFGASGREIMEYIGSACIPYESKNETFCL